MTYSHLCRYISVTLAGVWLMLAAGAVSITLASDLTTNIAPPSFSHVFIVMDENHSYDEVVGAIDMPYLNQLISTYGIATNYYSDAHPSIGNYFMLTTGATITKNDAYARVVRANNVVRILKSHNLTWKAYIEDLPADPNADALPYLRHHNPFSFFSDVRNDTSEASNMVDFSQLDIDITNGALPNYGFIVPNAYHSAHGEQDSTGGLCANPNDQLAEADCWLQTEIDPLISYLVANKGLLILTWDEGDQTDKAHGGGHIATVLVSGVSMAGFQSSAFYQHQSTLRLMLQALGITRFPGKAARAPQMGEFFNAQ